MKYPDVFTMIKGEEKLFEQDHEITSNWFWNFKTHINWTVLFKHGKFPLSKNDYTRVNKNIVLPIQELRYRAEDIDLKDIIIYADDKDQYHLSFLAKKYHDEVYATSHKLNTFFDEVKEEKIDFGGVIVRKGADGPLYEHLETIAFCDKTDFTKGPICFKVEYSPEELYEKKKLGWGTKGADMTIDDLLTAFEVENTAGSDSGFKPKDKLEIYRLHGFLPGEWIDSDEKFVRQICVVAFYQNSKGNAQGVTLYHSKELKNPFKIHLDGKKIKNRCLAFGGVERLFDPQIWTNFSEIAKHDFLKAASKILLWSDDETFANKNNLKLQENLELSYLEQGKQVGQIPTTPVNIQLFNQWVAEMQEHAQRLGSATDPLFGEPAPSGTPFRAQERQVIEGKGIHEYRKEKYEDFIQEIYTDWIIPDMLSELTEGKEFMASLSADELEYVVNCIVKKAIGDTNKERVLSGQLPLYEDEKLALEERT